MAYWIQICVVVELEASATVRPKRTCTSHVRMSDLPCCGTCGLYDTTSAVEFDDCGRPVGRGVDQLSGVVIVKPVGMTADDHDENHPLLVGLLSLIKVAPECAVNALDAGAIGECVTVTLDEQTNRHTRWHIRRGVSITAPRALINKWSTKLA